MNVITISRQMGSLGDPIARALASELGFRLVDREIINQAAAQIGSPELALAMMDELGLLGICPSKEICQEYIQAVHTIMIEIANQGDVIIVGRGGQVLLKDFPESFHLLIIAPLPCRAKRIAEDQGISIESAQHQASASDHHRNQYLKRFYDSRWMDPIHYDLILNTARLNSGTAVKIILDAVRA